MAVHPGPLSPGEREDRAPVLGIVAHEVCGTGVAKNRSSSRFRTSDLEILSDFGHSDFVISIAGFDKLRYFSPHGSQGIARRLEHDRARRSRASAAIAGAIPRRARNSPRFQTTTAPRPR